jgi:hypothetical protein
MRSYPRRFAQALSIACEAHPSQRTCQILVNALGGDPFYMEDDAAIHKLYEYAELANQMYSNVGR